MSDGGLTIGQLAERTGAAAGTLRMWESRYGFPRARRLASGHRRYSEEDVEHVRDVLRRRESGLSLPAAIEQALARAEIRSRSSPGCGECTGARATIRSRSASSCR